MLSMQWGMQERRAIHGTPTTATQQSESRNRDEAEPERQKEDREQEIQRVQASRHSRAAQQPGTEKEGCN